MKLMVFFYAAKLGLLSTLVQFTPKEKWDSKKNMGSKESVAKTNILDKTFTKNSRLGKSCWRNESRPDQSWSKKPPRSS